MPEDSANERKQCESCGKRPAEPDCRYCTHCDKLRLNAREAYHEDMEAADE